MPPARRTIEKVRTTGSPGTTSRTLWVLVALALVSFGCTSQAPGASSTMVPHARAAPTTSTTTPPPTTTPTPATTPTTAPPTTTTVPPAVLIGLGASGPAVLALQQQLVALGYWLGTPDGTFGDTTEQAVYALQKAAGLDPDGVVGPLTEAALARGARPQPRSTAGYVIEVDLQHDLLMLVSDGRLEYVLNTSTGGGYTYTSDGVTAVADTPQGVFSLYREVDGLVVDSLGQLWRPKFFTGGFAIHGDTYVPPEPVSHGCVRVSNAAIDWMWTDDVAPLGTEVWVY